MRRWTREVESWMSILTRGTVGEEEAARLRMNATIQDINSLLVGECGLDQLLLYQSRPQ
jgi:hypothetical protein